MPPALAPSLLARLTRQHRRSRRQPEPADMGTAFGMEQWLDEQDQHGLAATATPATPAARALPKRSWLLRWLPGQSTT